MLHKTEEIDAGSGSISKGVMSDESTPGVSLLAFHVISVTKGLAPERNLSNIQNKIIVANNDSTK
jgi:hypothetical protein